MTAKVHTRIKDGEQGRRTFRMGHDFVTNLDIVEDDHKIDEYFTSTVSEISDLC